MQMTNTNNEEKHIYTYSLDIQKMDFMSNFV